MYRLLSAIGILFLLVACSEPKPPATSPPSPSREIELDLDELALQKALYSPPKLSVFLVGDGLRGLKSQDVVSDTRLYPGSMISVRLSDESETFERIEVSGNELCFREFDFNAKKVDLTTYRLFLTNHLGDHQLTLVANRVRWQVTGTPKLDRAERAKLLQDQPHCAFYNNYVGYGRQLMTSISFSYDKGNRHEPFLSQRLNTGLVLESTDLEKTCKMAKNLQALLARNGAELTGFSSATSSGTSIVGNLWDDKTALRQFSEDIEKALAEDEGYLSDPRREKIKFPKEVTGVAIETRVFSLDSSYNPHRVTAPRLTGLE